MERVHAFQFMGCGSSTANPAAAKYAAGAPAPEPEPVPAKSTAEAVEKVVASTGGGSQPVTTTTFEHEVVFSSASDAEGVVDRIVDELTKVGYRIGTGSDALASSKHVVLCLSSEFFSSSQCCQDLSTAVDLGLSVVFVIVDGATWNGKKYPASTDVPEQATSVDGKPLRPRDAFSNAPAEAESMLEHSRTYFEAFLQQLRTRIGEPADAARVQEALQLQSETAEIIKAKLSDSASGGERPVSVVIDRGDGSDEVDGGITLLRPGMMLAEVRTNLISDNAPEEGEEEEDDDPAAEVLGSGKFAFVRPGADGASVHVSRDEEATLAASDLGEPIKVATMA